MKIQKKESRKTISGKDANHKQWFIPNLYLDLGERRLSPSDKYQSGQQLQRFHTSTLSLTGAIFWLFGRGMLPTE